jgi:hypothetical protein
MPLYEFGCRCGAKAEEFLPVDFVEPPVCSCGAKMARELSRPAFVVPHYMRAENTVRDDGGHQAWIERPEVQAKLKSGEYEVVSRKRAASARDG